MSPSNSISVALTFDDGPTAGITDELLDFLKEKDIKASFFVIGKCLRSVDFESMYSNSANAYRDDYGKVNEDDFNFDSSTLQSNRNILSRMISEGHLVGNHSATHPLKKLRDRNHLGLAKLANEDVFKEIQQCQEIVYSSSGTHFYRPRFFRAPEGGIARSNGNFNDYFLDEAVMAMHNEQIGLTDVQRFNSPGTGHKTWHVAWGILVIKKSGFLKRLIRYAQRIFGGQLQQADWDDKSWNSETAVEEISNQYKQLQKLPAATKVITLSHDGLQCYRTVPGIKKGLKNVHPSIKFPGFHEYKAGLRRKLIKFVRIDEIFEKNCFIERGEKLLRGHRLLSCNRKYELTINSTGSLITRHFADDQQIPVFEWKAFSSIESIHLDPDGNLMVEANGTKTELQKNVGRFVLTNSGTISLYPSSENNHKDFTAFTDYVSILKTT